MRFHFYSLETGILTGKSFSFSGSKEACALNTPAGCGAIAGVSDWRAQRVELITRQLVDYQPPAPDAEHEWNAEAKRWRKRADVIEREAQRAQARARIDELERRQNRPMRELAIDPRNAQAAQRLAEIEAEIGKARQTMKFDQLA